MDFATFAPSSAAAHRLLEQAIVHLDQIDAGATSLKLLQGLNAQHQTVELEDPCYVLSLEDGKLPHDPRRGWVVGCSSRASDNGPVKVDFLVAKPYAKGQDAVIAPIHLVLRINYAGILTFSPATQNHKVEVLVDTEYEQIQFGQDRAITSPLTVLRLGGKAVYNLLFSILDKDLNGYLKRLVEIKGRQREPVDDRLIRFVPSVKTRVFRMSGICLNTGTLAAGAFGWVSEGFTLDGKLVAIKAFTVTRRSQYRAIVAEYKIGSVFCNAKYVTQALKLWCEHDQVLSQTDCRECAEAGLKNVGLYMSARLARGSFLHVFDPEGETIEFRDRVLLFNQSFRGLAEIWSMGIIHRDITLQNILVDSIDPPQASITDFGKATQYDGGKLYDTRIGPIPYVAPEVWTGQGYGRSIDLFSLALSLALLYIEPPWWPDKKVSKEKLEVFTGKLQELSRQQPLLNALVDLLCSILQWRVEDRITIEQALEHRCWDEVRDEITSKEELICKKLKLQEPTSSNGRGENDRSLESGPVATEPFSPGFYEAE